MSTPTQTENSLTAPAPCASPDAKEDEETKRLEDDEDEDEDDVEEFPDLVFKGNGILQKDGDNYEEHNGEFPCSEMKNTCVPKRRNVFVCLDNSKYSLETLEWCAKTLFRTSDLVTFLHAEMYTPKELKILPGIKLEYRDSNQASYAKTLERAKNFLRVATVRSVTFGRKPDKFKLLLINKKSVSLKQAVLASIEDNKPDLVVLGSRGLASVNRVLLGSTSDYLVHNATVPVLVYKCQRDKNNQDED